MNLGKKFMDSLQSYQQVQVQFREKQRERATRQIMIANPNVSQEELERALDETEAGGASVFSSQLLSGGGRYADSQLMKRDVEMRHQELMKLAQSIEQVQQMFNEMQALVDAQNDLVLNVVDNVDQTANNLRQTGEELQQAVVHRKSARKRKMILCICILVLLIVVGVICYIYLAPVINQAIDSGKEGSSNNSGNTSNSGGNSKAK